MTNTPHNNIWNQYLKAMGIQVWVRRHLPPDTTLPANPPIAMPLDTRIASNELTPVSEPPIHQSVTAKNDIVSPEKSPIHIPIETIPPNTPKNPQPNQTVSPTLPQPEDSPVSEKEWETLQNQVTACTACDLHKTRTKTVFGVGNRQADLMLIGEAPGADEDAQGEPFVGRAGQLLNDMLYAIDLKREDVYIANVVKCRPPENRNPHDTELMCCNNFLQHQIALLKPKLIIAVGRVAAHHLLSTTTGIGKLRGQRFEYGKTKIPLIATYHPAYLLRRPSEKRQSWRDLQFIHQMFKTICEKSKL
ncbi:uracil-DNA glycosylase [Candidatus Parabeggiatoa sp. HSG14]|uniref:uracil-DNA glycosylase n=1 Tax=Candidatus Parabeggiatoa sp. HSG14 TaxID=3055593 RepID=UPI0025A7F57B|nr:uracil-DNA glycosylase [Thiotrichales bacterium HSG14]